MFSPKTFYVIEACKETFALWMVLLTFVRILWIGKTANGITYAYWPAFGLLGFTSKRTAVLRASRKTEWLIRGMILALGVLDYFLSLLSLKFFQLFFGIAGLALAGFSTF